jgi:DNA-directed RNA polymerase subunit RPC12/RpoP
MNVPKIRRADRARPDPVQHSLGVLAPGPKMNTVYICRACRQRGTYWAFMQLGHPKCYNCSGRRILKEGKAENELPQVRLRDVPSYK